MKATLTALAALLVSTIPLIRASAQSPCPYPVGAGRLRLSGGWFTANVAGPQRVPRPAGCDRLRQADVSGASSV